MKHPNDEIRPRVQALAGYGLNQVDAAMVLQMSDRTLKRHYSKDWRQGKATANAAIGQTLFQQAKQGNMSAAIFWAKSQMGWSERAAELNEMQKRVDELEALVASKLEV